jgi:DNA-binding transcriptional ArsR family regulator
VNLDLLTTPGLGIDLDPNALADKIGHLRDEQDGAGDHCMGAGQAGVRDREKHKHQLAALHLAPRRGLPQSFQASGRDVRAFGEHDLLDRAQPVVHDYSPWSLGLGLAKKPGSALDNKNCQCYHLLMLDVDVIDSPAAATVALEPLRSRLLSELARPASAATLATRVGLARQKVNYHLRALESHGLVKVAERRKWGGLTERLLVATATSYVISPGALGPVAVDPAREMDRLSASYLIALGARVVREVNDLSHRAKEADKRLATLAVDTEVRFRSATDRAAFSQELTEAIAKLVSKYHDGSAPGGRAHRLVLMAHPLPQKPAPKETS